MVSHNRRGGMHSANASDNEGASDDDLSVDIQQEQPPSSPLSPVGSVRELPPMDGSQQRALERPGIPPMVPEGSHASLPNFSPPSGIDATAPPLWFSMYEPPTVILPSAYQPPEVATQRKRTPVFPKQGSQSSSASDQRYCNFCRGT